MKRAVLHPKNKKACYPIHVQYSPWLTYLRPHLTYVRQRSVLNSTCSGPIHLLLLASYTYLLVLVYLPGSGTPSPARCILATQTLHSLLNNNSKLIHAPLPLFPELGIPSLVLSSKLLIILLILLPFPTKDGFS